MRKIAFYGKGGIGKSTLTGSISAAMADMGYRVMQIGCDPKADSTINLTHGKKVTPVIEYLRQHGEVKDIEEIAMVGYKGIVCIESGGPTPGVGCAGRGIIKTFEILDELAAFDIFNPDFVFYDVLGDVVCGGFAMPIRNGYAKEVIIVTSGEKMSLFAASNIKAALDSFAEKSYGKLTGVVLNKRNIPREEEIVNDFVQTIGTDILGIVPRSDHIQKYEKDYMTVIEGDHTLEISQTIKAIAVNIINKKNKGGI